MSYQLYPSDLTDEQWALIEPHIPTLEDLYFAVRNKTRPGVFVRSHTPKSTEDES